MEGALEEVINKNRFTGSSDHELLFQILSLVQLNKSSPYGVEELTIKPQAINDFHASVLN